jgi:VWFA-related protein
MTQSLVKGNRQKSLFVLCQLLLFASSFNGWCPEGLAEPFQSETLRVNVDLITIEVAVKDKQGRSVPGLQKGDFKLSIDGKEQQILAADEVKLDGSLEGNRPGKVLLILFDDTLAPTAQLRTTRELAETFVARHMRRNDLAAVVVNGSQVTVFQNFTGETSKIVEAIRKSGQTIGMRPPELSSLGTEGSASGGDPILRQQPRNPSGLAAANLSRTLRYLTTSMMRVKGRKAILVFSNSPGPARSLVNPQGQVEAQYQATFDQGMERATETSKQAVVPIYAIDLQKKQDWSEDLKEIDAELSNYYVLGFQSISLDPKSKSHRLRITTVSKGAQLKYTSELAELDSRQLTVTSKREEVLTTALESSSPVHQLPISLAVPYFYSSPDRVRVAISAKIQSGGLKFKKEGGQLVCALDVMGQALAESGDIVARFAESYRAVRDEKNHDSAVFYQRMMKLAPGKYTIKLALADDNKQVGSAERALVVPRMLPGRLAMSSLVVTQQATALPSLIGDIQSQLMQEDDPLIYKSYQVSVVPGSYLDRAKPMFIFYRLYNVGDQEAQYDLEAKAQITDARGQTNVIPSIPLNPAAVPSGDRQVSIGISMPTSELLPGKYRLRVETTERKTLQSVSGETELEVK